MCGHNCFTQSFVIISQWTLPTVVVFVVVMLQLLGCKVMCVMCGAWCNFMQFKLIVHRELLSFQLNSRCNMEWAGRKKCHMQHINLNCWPEYIVNILTNEHNRGDIGEEEQARGRIRRWTDEGPKECETKKERKRREFHNEPPWFFTAWARWFLFSVSVSDTDKRQSCARYHISIERCRWEININFQERLQL